MTQLLRPQALETYVLRLLPSLPVGVCVETQRLGKGSWDIHAQQGRASRGQLAPFLGRAMTTRRPEDPRTRPQTPFPCWLLFEWVRRMASLLEDSAMM